MNRQQLEQFLQKKIPQASLLYGECPFWIERYSQIIAQRTTTQENIAKFYFGDYDYAQIMNLLSQSSLFGENTLVVLKIDKKIAKKELQSFLKVLERVQSNYLLIEFYRSDSKSSSEYARDFREMAGLFKGENQIEVRFFEPNLSECQMLLAQRAKELGIEIQMRSLMLLLNIQNGDIAIALKELEKFVYWNRPIEEREIHELCSSIGSIEFDDFFDSLLARKKSETMDKYARLEEEGLDEMSFLSAMGSYFYRLFLFFAYIRSNGKADAKEILGYAPPQFVVQKIAKEAMSLREEQYKMIFEVLLQWRVSIFSGKGKNSNAIVALHKLQEILG